MSVTDAQRKYRNSPRGKAKAAEYREKNRRRRLEYMKKYREENREQENERAERWRTENPDKDKQNKAEYRAERKRLKIEAIQAAGGCAICGFKFDGTNACVFDLHHINPSEKVKTVGNCRGIPQFKQEMAKCSVICSNCHRVLHRRD
jgi:predicted HNH restriction endonuclease